MSGAKRLSADAVLDRMKHWLMPCPFCGNEEQMFLHNVKAPEERGWSVICGGKVQCAASVGRHVDFTKVEAIAAWNRRTPS